MEIRRTGNIWHSPYNVYKHLLRLSKVVAPEAIEKEGKYKPVREARLAAVVALILSQRTKKPAYVQLPPHDPPDAYLMQQSLVKNGQLDITTLEITSYRYNSDETLLDQLKRTKTGQVQKYSDEYVLAVELLSKEAIDYDAIREYLNTAKIPFPVWTLFGKTVDGSTTAEFTIINPETYQSEINIGEAAFNLKQQGMLDVIFTKRTGSEKSVRTEPAGTYELPPWEGLIK
ncbi:MAG: hypothetical protein A2857_03735 [Candidatus Levybacteria bacterium RIFCSPHIGHO2_01_FULL_36_15]|nr:MAG: hypothetical protein A2857_03735 [Candidatus Levybacteria bacterium RIFCSPHIGHO2_01_FULL_36_15]OGH37246.1 MAG: hypothetical protein A2905_06125 [Candidatus Levybacteria bacterium RIFCSPLOWO2_01_FULL_36_10]